MNNQLQLGSFAPKLDPTKSQWHTPQQLAQRMVEWAGVKPGMRVLEPSAGGGNIVRELVAVGAVVEAVEIDPRWAERLRSEFPAVNVIETDFLEWTARDRYDWVVTNPPLDSGAGPLHVKHALTCAPRVVSILRAGDLHGVAAFDVLWGGVYLLRKAHLIRRPKFGPGSPCSEFVVVDVARVPGLVEGGVLQWW